MASGSVFAWNNITHYPVDSNWELTVKGPDYPGSTQADFVLSSASQPKDNTDAVIDLTFTDDLYDKVNAMDETMGKWGNLNEDQREDYWSTVSGLHMTETEAAAYTSLDIDLTANTTDASEGAYELAGIYLTGANNLTIGPANGEYEGTTNISVTGNYDVPTSEDKPSSLVAGLISEAYGESGTSRVSFNTRATNITVSATGSHLLPTGVTMMNGSHLPVIEFHGDETTISVKSATGNAMGMWLMQDDLMDDPNPEYRGVLNLQSAKTTISVEGADTLGI